MKGASNPLLAILFRSALLCLLSPLAFAQAPPTPPFRQCPHIGVANSCGVLIVINANKVKVTGRKAEQKKYFHHTGYMGHERYTPYGTMIEKHPERVIEKAVYGMLPKTALGLQVLRGKLRVYAGAEHPHVAQQPKPLTFTKGEK